MPTQQPNTRQALACLLDAKGIGRPHAWQCLRQSSPDLAGYLATLGKGGWPALVKEIDAIRHKNVLAFEALLRAEGERHRRDATEAWETVRGAGGQENGADRTYLDQVCPTAAQRLRDAAADADARESQAWFSWTKRKARASAWGWTEGYLTRSHQKEDGPPAWREDFDVDTRARLAKARPKDAYAITWEGAAAAWAAKWIEENRPTSTEEEDTMEKEIKHPLTILAEMQGWRADKPSTLPTEDDRPPETDDEAFEDLFEDA